MKCIIGVKGVRAGLTDMGVRAGLTDTGVRACVKAGEKTAPGWGWRPFWCSVKGGMGSAWGTAM